MDEAQLEEIRVSRMKNMEKSRQQDMAGRSVMRLREPLKKSLEQSIQESKQELEIVENLRTAILKYMAIYDCFAEESENGLCLILGRLDFSIAQRKQILVDDNKKWIELD